MARRILAKVYRTLCAVLYVWRLEANKPDTRFRMRSEVGFTVWMVLYTDDLVTSIPRLSVYNGVWMSNMKRCCLTAEDFYFSVMISFSLGSELTKILAASPRVIVLSHGRLVQRIWALLFSVASIVRMSRSPSSSAIFVHTW